MKQKYKLPQNIILLISGVPGVGKSTISYEILKTHKEFRLIEETDVIREILRGYNTYLFSKYGLSLDNIYPHNVFLDYDMAKQQCKIMRNSIINIIQRQQRKEIPTIINGVHIIPEELHTYINGSNIVYINLYVDSEKSLWNRLKKRDPKKYKPDCVALLFQANIDLKNSLSHLNSNIICYNINVSVYSIQEILDEINKIFHILYGI